MGVFFGTDGIRGEFNTKLGLELAMRTGKALASLKSNAKILIGRDTRESGELLAAALALGAASLGAEIYDTQICPSAGISYLTKKLKYDFGVMISASHNPAKFNGIKIFNKNGEKLEEILEIQIEKRLFSNLFNVEKLGHIKKVDFIGEYKDFLIKQKTKLTGLKIVLDCANGTASFVAAECFKKLGAEVMSICDKPNGKNINANCGATDLKKIVKYVKKYDADMGFAFDGDSDRVMAVDESGNIVDGDKIIYLFALDYLKNNKLKNCQVVGTVMTNGGIEDALKNKGIELLRADVGDKYVYGKLAENNLLIGGEQSGHIILKDKLVTGDGILNAILLAEICKKENKKLSEFFDFKEYKQLKLDVNVKNENLILKCKKWLNYYENLQNEYKNNIRLLIRESGTEPKIRILAEAKSEENLKKITMKIKKYIEGLDEEFSKCVE